MYTFDENQIETTKERKVKKEKKIKAKNKNMKRRHYMNRLNVMEGLYRQTSMITLEIPQMKLLLRKMYSHTRQRRQETLKSKVFRVELVSSSGGIYFGVFEYEEFLIDSNCVFFFYSFFNCSCIFSYLCIRLC